MLYSPPPSSGFMTSADEWRLPDADVLVGPAWVEFGALIGAVPSPVVVLDSLGRVVLASDAWIHFPHAGMLAPHRVGENLVDGCLRVSGPLAKEAREIAAGIQAVLNGALPRFAREYAYILPDQRRWALLQAAPIRDGAQGAVVELTDITARKQVETVARARQAAPEDRITASPHQRDEDASHRLELFVSLAAHELRTPLSAVKSYLAGADQLLSGYMAAMEAVAPDSQKLRTIQEGIQSAQQASRMMGTLLDELLQTARGRAGKLVMEPKRTDLIALVRHVVKQEQQVHPALRLRLSTRRISKLMLDVDPTRITQVLSNLLDNAWKYSPAHQPVVVSVEGAGEVVRVAVQDRGPGLPRQEQGRVWECYYQSASEQFQAGQRAGLGIGLYLVRQIVEQHGGQVGVESRPGEGSTFWFTLPRA